MLSDCLFVNPAFDNQNIRINLLPTQSKKEQQIKRSAEDQEIREKALISQAMHIEAHIVKQMKTNKILPMAKLIEKVMESLNLFRAQPQMIKHSIQNLIEKEYLERDKDDRTKLIYIP